MYLQLRIISTGKSTWIQINWLITVTVRRI